MRTRSFVLLLTLAFVATLPICAQPKLCTPVGGVLMTNIDLINGLYNLGPVFGDLGGSVAAQIVSVNPNGTFTVQHYWATNSGDTILFKPAILTPTYPVANNTNIVAVPWGNYISAIDGGTGKYANATGSLSYFGMADFSNNTLVLRFSGTLCFP
jgi:hypothetical protein